MAHAATCDTWTHAVLQIRCRSAHHRLRQRKMAPQIVTEGHKPQRIRYPYRYAKMCDITARSVSRQITHISAEYTPGTGSDTKSSRDRTRQALPTQARRLCFGVVGRAAVRRRAVRSKFKRGGGPRFAFVVPIDCGPSGVGGRRMGNRNGARLVSPEWDEGVRFRSADVAHISLSSARPVARRGPRASDG